MIIILQRFFAEKAIEYAKSQILLLKKAICFSDGCTTQYKGSGSMAALSLNKMKIDWNFYGSDHGKGEADGELGSLIDQLRRHFLVVKQ